MMSYSLVTRVALMLVARDNMALSTLKASLLERRDDILAVVRGQADIRLGVRCDPDPLEDVMRERKSAGIDAAIELTAPVDRLSALLELSTAVAGVLKDLIDPAETLLMGGTTYRMVPARPGGVFLSLAFRRDPAVTVEQFRAWWRDQHAGLAISLLSPALLGYDQVHVDPDASRAAAIAAGLRYDGFDAYDNLTWASVASFMASVNDAEAQRQLYEDEQGNIDNLSNRAALMRHIEL